jgi:hypothetical protein
MTGGVMSGGDIGSGSGSGTVLFYSGAEMTPSAIRAKHPGARFIARAHLIAREAEIAGAFARTLVDRGEAATVWGIAVRIPETIGGKVRKATTDEGAELDAVLAEPMLAAGEPEAVLNAALYWELPPAYTTLLRAAAGVTPPAPEGGWETPPLEAESPAP